MNSDTLTRCTHWLCTGCWANLRARGQVRCPVCRSDVSERLLSHYPVVAAQTDTESQAETETETETDEEESREDE